MNKILKLHLSKDIVETKFKEIVRPFLDLGKAFLLEELNIK